MTSLKFLLFVSVASLASLASAHEGHGTPGTFGHDMQHQLWTFAALVAVGALLLAGDRVMALLRVFGKKNKDSNDDK